MTPLDHAIAAAADAPRLLVASDFDGVLAPISPRPELAAPEPGALLALRSLAAAPRTLAAVISGRGLADLKALVGPLPGVRLVGSHGAEPDGRPQPLTPDQAALRDRLLLELGAIADETPGLMVEPKPAGAAFHYRLATPAAAQAALSRVWSGPAAAPGVFPRQGKAVLDLAVTRENKGEALEALRQEHRPDVTVFLGDDLTDEDAFAILGDCDAGVLVGSRPTQARYRVPGPAGAWGVLRTLASLRDAHEKRGLVAP